MALVRPSVRVTRRRLQHRAPVTIVLAALVIAAVVLAAAIGGLVLGERATAQNLLLVGRGPSPGYLLGTDELGRDVWARIVVGARAALVGPAIIAASGLVFSALIGILSGYVGGALDSVIMRAVDFVFSLPSLLLTIVIVAVVGGGYWLAIVVLSILNMQGDIRIVRGVALEQRSLPYIEAARTVGVPRWRIMYGHIFPNIVPILVANFATDFAGALVALSGLAFLGLGSQPGTPEWGRMLTDGQPLLFTNAWAAVAPGVAIVALAVAVNLMGDWLYERYASRDSSTR